jgi:hypothetical protein
MTRPLFSATAVAMALLMSHHAITAAKPGNVVDLGHLGGCCSEGYGINMFGDVVGVSNLGNRSGTQRAFWRVPLPP